MNKLSDKEIIYASYSNSYYGFEFPKEPSLLELDILYDQILNSKFSNKIKRKLMARLKYKVRFVESDESIKEDIRENFKFKLN